MSKARSRFDGVGRAVLAAIAMLAAAAPASADWRWNFTPYFWASEIGTDVSVNDQEVIETEADLADLIDGLDFAIQVHAEGQNGKHGVFFDLTYMDMGDDDRVYPLSGPLGGEIVAKGDLEQTLIEAGGIYNPRGDGTGLSILYGTRILDVDQETDVRIDVLNQTLAERRFEASSTLVDGLIGARFVHPINERWSYLFRADVSGGDTELTWNAQTGFGFTFGAQRNKTLFFGYRYMEMEFEEADRLAEIELQNKMGGVVVGLKFGS